MRNLTHQFIQETEASLTSFDVWDSEPTITFYAPETDDEIADRRDDMLSAFLDLTLFCDDDPTEYTASDVAWFRVPIGGAL